MLCKASRRDKGQCRSENEGTETGGQAELKEWIPEFGHLKWVTVECNLNRRLSGELQVPPKRRLPVDNALAVS